MPFPGLSEAEAGVGCASILQSVEDNANSVTLPQLHEAVLPPGASASPGPLCSLLLLPKEGGVDAKASWLFLLLALAPRALPSLWWVAWKRFPLCLFSI